MKSYRDHFGMIVNAVMAICMGFFMGMSILLLNHTPITWVSLYSVWSRITLTVILVTLVVPLAELGDRFAGAVKCKPGTLVFKLVANIVPTFVINTVLTAVLTAMDIFFNADIPAEMRMDTWINAFFSGWTAPFFIAFFFGLLSAKIGQIVAARTLMLNPGVDV